MTSRSTIWRGKHEAREYARLTSFDYQKYFGDNFNWPYPLDKIRNKTEFLKFAKECSKGLPPYSVAKELNISPDTAYLWIEKLLEHLKQ